MILMFKFFYFFLFFCLFQVAIPAIAQRYGTAMGIRFGNSELSRTVGLSVQQRVLERVTLEAILQSDFSRNTNFSLLAERHRPIIQSDLITITEVVLVSERRRVSSKMKKPCKLTIRMATPRWGLI